MLATPAMGLSSADSLSSTVETWKRRRRDGDQMGKGRERRDEEGWKGRGRVEGKRKGGREGWKTATNVSKGCYTNNSTAQPHKPHQKRRTPHHTPHTTSYNRAQAFANLFSLLSLLSSHLSDGPLKLDRQTLNGITAVPPLRESRKFVQELNHIRNMIRRLSTHLPQRFEHGAEAR